MTASPVVLKVAIVGRLTVFFLVVFEGLSSSNCQLIVIGNLGINAFVLLLLWSVMGIENSHHVLNQSDYKQKDNCDLHVFIRAFGSLPVFTLSSHWFLQQSNENCSDKSE